MPKFPQVLLNVKVATALRPDEVAAVQEAVREGRGAAGWEGRVVLRASGTEPVIRVMVEGATTSWRGQSPRELADVGRRWPRTRLNCDRWLRRR